MKTRTSIKTSTKTTKHFALCALALSTLAAVRDARAVILEEKWQAGQELSYALKMDGTLHLTAPEGVPMIAGLPLEILLKGDGQSTLIAADVDEFGTATVANRLERLQVKLSETTFNQNGVLGIRDGKATFTMNGQPVMQPMDVSRFINPPYGLRVTKQLHVVGASPLKQAETAPPADEKKPATKLPFDTMAIVQAMMARSLPAILPAKDVALGDAWNANVEFPLPPNMAKPELQKPAGEFNLKALAEEEILGRKTWRIALDGELKIDEAQAKILADELTKQRTQNADGNADGNIDGNADNDKTKTPIGNLRMPQLFALTQKLKGDLWFDAAAGQMVRADLNISSAAQTRASQNAKPSGAMDYDGNFKMELRKVSYESENHENQ